MDNQQLQPDQNKQRQLQVKISDEVLKGVYSNAMQATHSREEFTIDFLHLSPHQGAGVVSAKIIMSPGHLKRMISALQDNVKKYEEKFGNIEKAQSLEEPVGFKNK